MTKTKKLSLGIVLVMLCLVLTGAAFALGFSGFKTASADAEWSFVEEDELAAKYYYGATLTVPQKIITVDGTDYNSEYTVVFPSGKAYVKQSVVLSEVGYYKIRYRAIAGESVYYDEENFFVSADNFQFADSSLGSTMEYGVYDKLGQTNGIQGLMINMHKDDVLRFNQVIKVSDLTSQNAIANFFPAPEQTGVWECSGVLFRLVDTLDPDNWVEFDIHGNVNFISGHSYAWMTVAANGQKSLGYEEGKGYHYKDNWGTSFWNVSFRAQKNVDMNGNAAWSGAAAPLAPGTSTAKFYFDAVEGLCYAGSKYCNDLNDPTIYPENVWGGFTSEYVRLEIRLDGVVGSYANFVLVGVLGINIDNRSQSDIELVTDLAPEIVAEGVYENMPKAKIGEFYALPTATAIDHIFGECEVQTSVIFNRNSETDYVEVETVYKDGKFGFIPTKIGDYAIILSATNPYGNSSQVVVDVSADVELDPIEVILSDDLLALDGTEHKLGETITFGDATAQGGSGAYEYATYYKIGDGEPVEITGNTVLPVTVGEYTITCEVIDYLGEKGSSSVTFTGYASDDLMIHDTVTIAKIYISDIEYTLPALKGVLYKEDGSSEEKLAQVRITFNGETTEYTSGESFITPKVETNGETFDMEYYFDDQVYQEFNDIPIIIGKRYNKSGKLVTGVAMVENYFYGEGVTASFYPKDSTVAYPTGIEISVNESCEEAGWTFANAQVAEGVSVGIKGIAGDSHKVENMEFVLTDAYDSTKVITVLLEFNSKRVRLSNGANDVLYDYSSKSIFDGNTYEIKYVDGKVSFSGASVEVEKFDDGTEFNGFPSSLVYVTLKNVSSAQGNVKKLTRYLVVSVWGCIISVDRADRQAPAYSLLGNLTGSRAVGSTLLVPKAVCRDVFNPNSTITVSVTDVNGNYAKSTDGLVMNAVPCDVEYEVVLSTVGSYSVYYTTTEVGWNGNSKRNINLIRVVDRVKPVASFSAEPVTTASRGDVIKFAEITASDNITPSDKLVIVRGVLSAGGKYVMLFDNDCFVPDYIGDYEFLAIVRDEAGNFTTLRYTVKVVK